MRFSLDTNVLVYALDRQAGARHAIGKTVVERANAVDAVLTMQGFGELFNVLTRKIRQPPRQARADVERYRAAFPIVAADERCLVQAMDAVVDHTLSFWDALLLTTVANAGCRFLLSEDLQDGRAFAGVTIVNPFDPSNDDQLAALLAG